MGRDKRHQPRGESPCNRRAGLSVRQETVQTPRLCGFFNDLGDIIIDTIPPYPEGRVGRWLSKAVSFETTNNEANVPAITIAEHTLVGRAAVRYGGRWGAADMGGIRGTLAHRLWALRDRLNLPQTDNGALKLVLSAATRMGQPGTQGAGRNIVLLPDPEDPVGEYLRQAHAVAHEVLRYASPQVDDDRDYMPHLTVACIGTAVPLAAVGRSTSEVDALVRKQPVVVHLGAMLATGYNQQVAALTRPCF